MPPNAPRVKWALDELDTNARGGAAVMRRMVGRTDDKPDGPRMNLTLYIPARKSGPVPVLLNLTFGSGIRGQATRKTGQRPALGKGDTSKPAAAKGAAGFDPIEAVLNHGWAYASLPYGDIQPDRADRGTEGVIGVTLKSGQTRPAADEWGAIGREGVDSLGP
jgi:hypothetical protein